MRRLDSQCNSAADGASVKLAVAFTGCDQLTGTKRRLVGRHIFADISEPDPFGQALAYELERTYGAHRIDACMLLADGETWIKHLAGDWLPTARYQCDHWHLATRIREFCEREETRFRRMLDRAFSAPHRLATQLLAGRWKGDPAKARELSIYHEQRRPPAHVQAHGSRGVDARLRPGREAHRAHREPPLQTPRHEVVEEGSPQPAGHPTGGDRHKVAVRSPRSPARLSSLWGSWEV